MRLMSFALTTEQMRFRTKTVTRRLGWKHAKPGDVVLAVEKARGVRVEDRRTLYPIRFVSVVREPLSAITYYDTRLEGFPGYTRSEFVDLFCRANKCNPSVDVTRIEFEEVKP